MSFGKREMKRRRRRRSTEKEGKRGADSPPWSVLAPAWLKITMDTCSPGNVNHKECSGKTRAGLGGVRGPVKQRRPWVRPPETPS